MARGEDVGGRQQIEAELGDLARNEGRGVLAPERAARERQRVARRGARAAVERAQHPLGHVHHAAVGRDVLEVGEERAVARARRDVERRPRDGRSPRASAASGGRGVVQQALVALGAVGIRIADRAPAQRGPARRRDRCRRRSRRCSASSPSAPCGARRARGAPSAARYQRTGVDGRRPAVGGAPDLGAHREVVDARLALEARREAPHVLVEEAQQLARVVEARARRGGARGLTVWSAWSQGPSSSLFAGLRRVAKRRAAAPRVGAVEPAAVRVDGRARGVDLAREGVGAREVGAEGAEAGAEARRRARRRRARGLASARPAPRAVRTGRSSRYTTSPHASEVEVVARARAAPRRGARGSRSPSTGRTPRTKSGSHQASKGSRAAVEPAR